MKKMWAFFMETALKRDAFFCKKASLFCMEASLLIKMDAF